MSNTGDLLFPEDDEDLEENAGFLPSSRLKHRPLSPRRRMGRINVGKPRIGGSVIEHHGTRHQEMLRRTSSADADKHLGINSNSATFEKSKYKSSSEFSLNHSHKGVNNADLDNVVEFIQKLTSSRSMSSDKKLQYVSELILNLDLDNNNHKPPKITRRRYSPSAKIIRKISRKNSLVDKKPSDEIADLNRRLCRSLDNILDIDSNGQKNEDLDQSQSMFHIPNSYHFKTDNAISVVHETNEMSSKESIDSMTTDGGSRVETTSENTKDMETENSFTSANTKNQVDKTDDTISLVSNGGTYIIFHKHSRERSIDCTPKHDSTKESETKKDGRNDEEEPKETFNRRSVTRTASIYKKRPSWNLSSKMDQDNGENPEKMADSEFENPYQEGKRNTNSPTSVSSDTRKDVSFEELDFSNGIFGSAPRKSMLSLSTDLGYDSQHDQLHSDDHIVKDQRSTFVGTLKDRRHSITCGTSALRLRRTSSNDPDGQAMLHILKSKRNFKEYKV